MLGHRGDCRSRRQDLGKSPPPTGKNISRKELREVLVLEVRNDEFLTLKRNVQIILHRISSDHRLNALAFAFFSHGFVERDRLFVELNVGAIGGLYLDWRDS